MTKFGVGRMRDLVTWQTSDAGATDDFGQVIESWTDQGTHYAEVVFDPGSEAPNASQMKAVAKGKIKMWDVGPIKPSDRFLYNETGRIFNIVSVRREDNINRFLLIEFSELVNPQ